MKPTRSTSTASTDRVRVAPSLNSEDGTSIPKSVTCAFIAKEHTPGVSTIYLQLEFEGAPEKVIFVAKGYTPEEAQEFCRTARIRAPAAQKRTDKHRV